MSMYDGLALVYKSGTELKVLVWSLVTGLRLATWIALNSCPNFAERAHVFSVNAKQNKLMISGLCLKAFLEHFQISLIPLAWSYHTGGTLARLYYLSGNLFTSNRTKCNIPPVPEGIYLAEYHINKDESLPLATLDCKGYAENNALKAASSRGWVLSIVGRKSSLSGCLLLLGIIYFSLWTCCPVINYLAITSISYSKPFTLPSCE